MNSIVNWNYENKLESDLGLKGKPAVELFYENPCKMTFREISRKVQTHEMIELAISVDGTSIIYASKKLLTYDLCIKAVSQEGYALKWVPKKHLTSELCEIAVKNNGMAIQYVPNELITLKMSFDAVRNCPKDMYYENYPIYYVPTEFLTKELALESVICTPLSLRDIPQKLYTKELLALAIEENGAALEFIPPKYYKEDLLLKAIASVPTSIQFIPEYKRNKKICIKAFEADPLTIQYIPHNYITIEMCIKVMEKYYVYDYNIKNVDWFHPNLLNDTNIVNELISKIGADSILAWNERIIKEIKQNPKVDTYIKTYFNTLSNDTISLLKSKSKIRLYNFSYSINTDTVETQNVSSEATLIKRTSNTLLTHELTSIDNDAAESIYYISDIHLEQQMKDFIEPNEYTYENIEAFIDTKITELLNNVQDTGAILLVAGDVAHTRELAYMFFRKLSWLWHGEIFAVLGNHELWDKSWHKKGVNDTHRTIEEIVNDYRENINFFSCSLLHNSIYTIYKNQEDIVLRDNHILSYSDKDLTEFFSKCTLIILGGVGFSGLNPKYNAETGLYKSTITTIEQDKKLSVQFRAIYDKINRCARDKQVIVLTHTPVENWTTEKYNPNWIYINGHTHINSLIRKEDGTTVLSDNQIGYIPQKWCLNRIIVSGLYDPFENLDDGIYTITSEQYKDFNLGRGIYSKGCNYPGTIYALKRDNYYLFLLKSDKSLCILIGGHRKKLDYNDIYYYYDNMTLYVQKVIQAIKPYNDTLKLISNEIKLFGGNGIIHGCIVDIDFFNHVYLNPFDGKITPYFAYDMNDKYVFSDIPTLLKEKCHELSHKFIEAHRNGEIPLLSKYASCENGIEKKLEMAVVPDLVLGTEMYAPSRIMRAIQYIFDNNVIRVWNNEILNANNLNPIPIESLEGNIL